MVETTVSIVAANFLAARLREPRGILLMTDIPCLGPLKEFSRCCVDMMAVPSTGGDTEGIEGGF